MCVWGCFVCFSFCSFQRYFHFLTTRVCWMRNFWMLTIGWCLSRQNGEAKNLVNDHVIHWLILVSKLGLFARQLEKDDGRMNSNETRQPEPAKWTASDDGLSWPEDHGKAIILLSIVWQAPPKWSHDNTSHPHERKIFCCSDCQKLIGHFLPTQDTITEIHFCRRVLFVHDTKCNAQRPSFRNQQWSRPKKNWMENFIKWQTSPCNQTCSMAFKKGQCQLLHLSSNSRGQGI